MSDVDNLFTTSYVSEEQLSDLSGQLPEWLVERKKKALTNYNDLTIDQDTLFYKYTTFRSFDPEHLTPYWQISSEGEPQIAEFHGLRPHVVEQSSSISGGLPDTLTERGVFFGSIRDLIERDEELAKKVIEKAVASDRFDKLGELAKAFSKDILVLYVPRGVVVDELLYRHVTIPTTGTANYSESIVYLEQEAEVKLLEYFVSDHNAEGDQLYLTSQTIILENAAKFVSLSLQNWGGNVVHAGSKFASISDYARMYTLQQFQGGNMSRFNSGVKLIGRGAEGYDLFNSFGNHKQRYDFKSELSHIAEGTIGQTHSRTVMMNRAESILRGLIHIPKTGKNADSYLTSNGLTVGMGKVTAVPALQIDQNEVMAAHAASVEPLNREKLFYIESRGVEHEKAKEMLVKGYFEPVTRLLPDETLQQIARDALSDKWEESKDE